MNGLSSVVVADARNATRIPVDSENVIAVLYRAPGEEMLVGVHDESLGGLGLKLDDARGLQLGAEYTIVFAGSVLTATLMHVTPEIGGGFVAGFRCAEGRRASSGFR